MAAFAVDTRRITERRTIRLESFDDLAAEIERVAAAVAAGRVRPLGNWSPAQVLWHIGRLIEFSIDGFPFRYRRGIAWMTWLIRLVSWRWLIALAFRPGFTNPPEAKTLEPDAGLELEAAVSYVRRQLARVRDGEKMTQACSIDGAYSHEQWLYIHLRHAELHLSFLALRDP